MKTTEKFNPASFETKWPRTTLTSSRDLRPRLGRARIRGKQSFRPVSFETKWQKTWEREGVYQPDLKQAKRPFYNLMMFPYPSAEGLHVGNMYAFTGADIYGRFMRMKGFDVFEPIGLDGFGIHSENYAIKIGRHPKEQAKISEKNFYRQLHAIGNGFAWRNTLETYDVDYYRWTQWIFVQMFKHGLAYRKKSPVNFCPSCKTVLADEQVINEACERCKTVVEKRQMEQWFFRITNYAERLLQNTYKKSFRWSEKVKIGQRNWIGKKEGINIKYQISNIKYQIECFTTRPDTNFGATFVVLAPEHPFVGEILTSPKLPKRLKSLIKTYLEKAKKKTEMERIAEGREKTGVFTGFYCINPLNNYKMPLFISDFVLMEFGTGAVVGVPAHDRRDYEFAKKFKLDIKVVVLPEEDGRPASPAGGWKMEDGRLKFKIQNQWIEGAYEGDGFAINSKFLNGLTTSEAIKKIMDHLEEKGWGKRVATYKLRDWCISRQRYWGAPIPMIYCPSCAEKDIGWLSLHLAFSPKSPKLLKLLKSLKEEEEEDVMSGWFPVPEEDLPVLLPPLSDWKPEGTGKGPLAKLSSFVKIKCPHCGKEAARETDVCDTFLDSSWYFLRYPSVNLEPRTKNQEQMGVKYTSKVTGWSVSGSHDSFEVEEARKDTPGMTRKSSLKVKELESPWDPKITRKWLPVTQYIGGAEHTVLHLLYSRFVWMCFYDWGLFNFSAKGGPASGWEEPFSRFYAHGLIIAEGAKMSKSKGNIIIPDEYIKKYGADTLRAYLMFLGPFDQGGDFRDTGVAGMYRFLARVWRLVYERLSHKPSKSLKSPKSLRLLKIMHKKIKEVTEDIENLRYNTAIAHIMEFVNELTHNQQLITYNHIKSLLLILAPFAPHMTEELWYKMNQEPKTKNQKQEKAVLSSSSRFSVQSWTSVHLHPWPTYDPKYLVEDIVTIVVQINGKLRETLEVGSEKSEVGSEIENIAKKSEKVKKYLKGKKIRKTIFVPGKLINFVT